MARIRVTYYWKRYMTKARYRCKRYLVYLPNSIGDALDTSIDYEVRLVDKLIVITPKTLSDVASIITKIESQWHKAKGEYTQSAESADGGKDAELWTMQHKT